MKNTNQSKLKDLLTKYSFEDLAKSFFVLNLWMPNISSYAKSQYLYVALESIFNQLSPVNKINNYADFETFFQELSPLLPSFDMVEDYIPESDWGEIKYFSNDKMYKIFYGGDLENPYDALYSFEVTHNGFEDFYLKKINRSAKKEFGFHLELQDQIINGINKGTQDAPTEIEIGDFKLPSEVFWKASTDFLNNFNPETVYDKKLIEEYTMQLDDTIVTEVPDLGEFVQKVHKGENCFYFFLKKDEKIFPVLPRRFFGILLDKWGKILSENYNQIKTDIPDYSTKIGFELYRFIRDRTSKENVLPYVCAIKADLKPNKTIFTTAFQSKNRIVLIHVIPPSTPENDQQKIIDALVPELKEANDLLKVQPLKLGLVGQGQMVQFESSKKNPKPLEPLIITAIPHTSSDMGMMGHPNDLVGETIGLDQLLGIIDEMDDLDDFADFFKYVEETRSSSEMPSLVSLLDSFGSFKDSHSVLIEGASQPDFIMLDPHWGSSFRYKSLSSFWKVFPQENFFGNPRGWSINEKALSGGSVMLRSKTFFGYTFYAAINQVSIFINSPVDKISFQEGKIANSLMHSLQDSFNIYSDVIKDLPFTKEKIKLHILFFPLSLVETEADFVHLNHLIPSDSNLWAMDTTRLKSRDYGIRVVFDDKKVISDLSTATDRSLQISLFEDVLSQINTIYGNTGYANVEEKLNAEKTQKNRFRIFSIEKKVSFPELSKHILPDTRELKLADKKIAEIGKSKNIQPGTYESQEAKEKIDFLKEGLLCELEKRINNLNYKDALPFIIGNIDSLSNRHEMEEAQVENSVNQEVDYQRDEVSGQNKQDYIHHHKTYQYLIEKIAHLQPTGSKELSENELSEILALADRLLLLYAVSDFLVYGIHSAKIEITHDFLVNIDYGEDINLKIKAGAEEQAKIRLGIIGKKDDSISIPNNINEYIDDLDKGFVKDLGFSLKDMIDVHNILKLWPTHNEHLEENVSYSASAEEIIKICVKEMKDVDPSTVQPILTFLTLDPKKILVVEGKDIQENDVPVWEHRKKTMRYSIRPLLEIDGIYNWAPYSIERSRRLWGGIAATSKLPSDINVPTVSAVLKKGHDATTKSLQDKIEEIVLRHTTLVETGVYPYKQKFCKDDIGDIDVFAFLKSKNIILNIESKIIDQAFCNKDLKRIANQIFGRIKEDETFKKGYLQKVIERDQFLKDDGTGLIEKYWGPVTEKPKIVSIFVTQSSYWWTKYPVIESDVHFVELALLDDYIKDLLKD